MFSSRIKGEKYNTPSLFRKIFLEIVLIKNIIKWKFISQPINKNKKFKILYPLQLQPEQNIDVWGYPYNNQTNLIKKISKTLKNKNIEIYIKLNPLTKYELSKEMIKLIVSNDNLIPLEPKYQMSDIINKVDLVITVTGSILFECVINKKPIISFKKT